MHRLTAYATKKTAQETHGFLCYDGFKMHRLTAYATKKTAQETHSFLCYDGFKMHRLTAYATKKTAQETHSIRLQVQDAQTKVYVTGCPSYLLTYSPS